MNGAAGSETQRSNRILAEKLRLLYRGNFAVPANFLIACIVAFLLSDSFPPAFLIAWLATTAVVVVLRILLYRRFVKASGEALCTVCWARRFCLGALASGLLWAAPCFGLPVWGTGSEYVMMTLVISGVSAGALTTIVTYLPAFFCYAGAMIMPLAASLLLHRDAEVATTGWLLLLYFVVIGLAAKNLSRSAIQGIELHVDNEALNISLKHAQADRDAARTEKWSTLAQLSHELRTPLNAVLGFSEVMHNEYFGPLGNDRYKEYVEHVYFSGKHLLKLIEEILQLSQGESGTLTLVEGDVDLPATVLSCIELMGPEAHKGEVELKTEFAADLPLLRADETKLRQIVINLVHNAIKFTPPNGRITVAANLVQEGGVVLSVRDTGIGIRPEDIPLAMQPFGRIASPLKHENAGMGIGLPLCKRLAELHGATFAIASQPGEGTVCTVAFPATRCITVEPPASAVAAV